MKNSILLISLTIFCLLSNQQFAAVVLLPTNHAQVTNNNSPITRTEIETKLGRKMNFKERIAWFFLKKKMNQNVTEEVKVTNNFASLGLIGMVSGILICFISYHLIILGVIMFLFGFISSIIALFQILANPHKYKDSSIVAIISGFLIFALLLIILSQALKQN